MNNLQNAQWHKSTHSGSDGGNCVEVSTSVPGVVLVRDSKNVAGPALLLPGAEWSAFVGGIKAGLIDV
ncbi:DUF397 domain-containing protein [Sphaerisporangium aureirubrum]|uniref:DUF397 domain-containing protein n=1 Tax=Sphaerisporangium aureirubrum TaxID=1544736 RepID=A0ABW1NTV7_9ACTN